MQSLVLTYDSFFGSGLEDKEKLTQYLARFKTFGLDFYRGTPCSLGTGHVYSQADEAVHQVLNGTLPHARCAVKHKITPACCCNGGCEGPVEGKCFSNRAAGLRSATSS